MSRSPSSLILSRRSLLAGAVALPAAARLAQGADEPGVAELAAQPKPIMSAAEPRALSPAEARRFVALRARLDGQPVFAVARGTEIAVIGSRAVPIHGSIILQATRGIAQPDGAWALPYVEATLVCEAATFRYLPQLANPLTGAAIAVPPPQPSLAPLRMSGQGVLSNQVRAPNGLAIDYDGHVALQAGLEGRDWGAQSLHIRIRRPGGEAEDIFVTTTMMQTGNARGGFLPTDSTSISLRPHLPAALGGGAEGALQSTYFGRKYATADALRRALDPDHRQLFEVFFARWREMLP